MRFLLIASMTALPLAASAAEAPAGKAPAASRNAPVAGVMDPTKCRRADVHRAEGPGTAEMKPLHELPPANLELAVVREVDGCHEPVIVRYGIGAGSDAPAPPVTDSPVRARRW